MLTIYPIVVGPIETNCYLVVNAARETLIIDPGAEAETIMAIIAREKLTPKAILITHGHYDHIMAVPELVTCYGLAVYYPDQDQYLLPAQKKAGILEQNFVLPSVQYYVDDINVSGFTLKIFHTPGHTIGQSCFLLEDNLFSGDMLFAGGYLGRTDLWGGSDLDMQDSLKKLLKLADNIKVFPGHGSAGTIGGERGYYE